MQEERSDVPAVISHTEGQPESATKSKGGNQ